MAQGIKWNTIYQILSSKFAKSLFLTKTLKTYGSKT